MTDKCPRCALVTSIVLSIASLVAISITIAITVIQFRDIDQRLDDLEAVDNEPPLQLSVPGSSGSYEGFHQLTRRP